MSKYKTLDQHVVYHGQVINPDTEVEVHTEEDKAIWEELVGLKGAVRVAEPKEAPAEELVVLEEAATIAEPTEAAVDKEQPRPTPPPKAGSKGTS